MSIVLHEHTAPKGCAIVQHGLGGTKDEKHIIAAAETFFKAGYTTVRFDATNSYGESDGTIEHATLTKHCEDLEDVITWVHTQAWSTDRLVLAGHSFGGYAVTRYAELYPQKVAAIFALSPVVSGALTLQAHELYEPGYIERWKESGWREDKSVSNPNRVRKLPWSHMEDRMKHDLIPHAEHLTMPVCIIVGDADRITCLEHMQLLFAALPGEKVLHCIPDCAHVYRTDIQIQEMISAIQSFLARV